MIGRGAVHRDQLNQCLQQCRAGWHVCMAMLALESKREDGGMGMTAQPVLCRNVMHFYQIRRISHGNLACVSTGLVVRSGRHWAEMKVQPSYSHRTLLSNDQGKIICKEVLSDTFVLGGPQTVPVDSA